MWNAPDSRRLGLQQQHERTDFRVVTPEPDTCSKMPKLETILEAY